MSKRECVRRNRWIGLWLLSALFISTAVQAVPCAGIQTSIDAGSAAEQLDQTLRIYQPLVEKSIAYRQASLQLANELKSHLDVGRPLTGKQLEQLNLGTRAHLDLRQALYGVAYQYECWLDGRMDKEVGMTSSQRLQGVMWDHPLILPWQAKIQQRHGVIEALRTGVTINPLSQFLNVDDLAVIRAADLSLPQRREVLLRAFRQIGKPYDFNFDLETTDRIVCSELVYTVYVDREWPVKKMLGRYTISPDHVADMVLNSPSLQLVALYHDGERVSARAEEKMQQLMAKR
ncbi:MAG: hypothetical protein KZQ99_21890 [Candidatus Thiodiazotropha sp. (ex Dulcina madagascariensis)]|nr:hypothetical protein [Candidatus Thiodiazotropha sp. (ex Dulcina madagascariensis)]